ncbi:hypothetical protein KBAD04_12270 [Aeromonas dhakensis]|nr:hypothetical protein KBAD04_12270 [Aeromonas dhakensis]
MLMKAVAADEAGKECAAELNIEPPALLLQLGHVPGILLGQQEIEPLPAIGLQCIGQWLRIE